MWDKIHSPPSFAKKHSKVSVEQIRDFRGGLFQPQMNFRAHWNEDSGYSPLFLTLDLLLQQAKRLQSIYNDVIVVLKADLENVSSIYE